MPIPGPKSITSLIRGLARFGKRLCLHDRADAHVDLAEIVKRYRRRNRFAHEPVRPPPSSPVPPRAPARTPPRSKARNEPADIAEEIRASVRRSRVPGRVSPSCARAPDLRRRATSAASAHDDDQPLRAHIALHAGGTDPAAASIHCCDRSENLFNAIASRGVASRRTRKRANRFAVRRQRLEAAHQHFEQAVARRFIGQLRDRRLQAPSGRFPA